MRILFGRPKERCPTDDEVRRTGVRFTVAQLNDMADAAMHGQTPPPLSFNENVLLVALYRQRLSSRLPSEED